MIKYALAAIIVLLLTASAYALPDASQDIWYYDSQGNVIGWWSLTCSGQQYSGGTTSEVYELFTMPCETTEPIMCSEIGMQSLSGCGDTWCYSSGYVMSFNNDMVGNCQGLCKFGEGPGASGNMWCSSCWKNTGSCPAKGKGGWKAPSTLTAAVQSKMWEVLALLRR
jgi:hypothetical protein